MASSPFGDAEPAVGARLAVPRSYEERALSLLATFSESSPDGGPDAESPDGDEPE